MTYEEASELRPGDLIKVIQNNCSHCYPREMILTVRESYDEDDRKRIKVLEGDSYVEDRDVEKFNGTRPEPIKLKPGDKIKIIGNSSRHNLKLGIIVTFKEWYDTIYLQEVLIKEHRVHLGAKDWIKINSDVTTGIWA